MPLGIYIHIPFCKSKCYYCGFYSITDISLENAYTKALLKEIEHKFAYFSHVIEKFKNITIFIGGGTPSFLSEENISLILEKILNQTKGKKILEFTIETNPESISEKKIKIYRSFNINRISLGLQSFDNKVLEFLGRPHSLETALKSYEILSKYFENISIDLIGGLPKFKTDFKKTKEFIKKLKPKHVSFYLLTKDKENKWFKRLKTDDESQNYDYELFCNIMKSLDYNHYEISNFALKNFECRHNLNYWMRGEYLGFGPSAVSFIKKFDGKNDFRLKNTSNLLRYIQNPVSFRKEKINPNKAFMETLFLSLRLSKGINKKTLYQFEKIVDVEKIIKNLDLLVDKMLINRKRNRWFIPEKNFTISNEIIVWLLKQTNT